MSYYNEVAISMDPFVAKLKSEKRENKISFQVILLVSFPPSIFGLSFRLLVKVLNVLEFSRRF